jgi:hypothetical protein
MPTVTTGVFFLTKRRPTPENIGGQFRLSLSVIDRQGERQVEPYEVTWHGPDAEAFWKAHASIDAGQPLRMELVNPRSFPGGRFGAPYTQATVRSCTLAPHAHHPHTPTSGAHAHAGTQ